MATPEFYLAQAEKEMGLEHWRPAHRLAVKAFDLGLDDVQMDRLARLMERLEEVDPL